MKITTFHNVIHSLGGSQVSEIKERKSTAHALWVVHMHTSWRFLDALTPLTHPPSNLLPLPSPLLLSPLLSSHVQVLIPLFSQLDTPQDSSKIDYNLW